MSAGLRSLLVGGVCAAGACAHPVWAAPEESCTITASADPTRITIGDPIHYTVTIEHDSGLSVRPPQLGANLGALRIKEVEVEGPKSIGDGRSRLVQRYVLTTFLVEDVTIPAVSVTCAGERQEPIQVTAPPVRIRVESLEPEGGFTGIRGLKGPVRLVVRRAGWIWWVVGLALLFGTILGGWWVWHRRQTRVATPPPPARPPEESAREALAQLAREDLIARGFIKEHHDRLSDIVRRYIEARYQVVALDRTTAELLGELRRASADARARDELRPFLDVCDLVKFATYAPSRTEIDAAMARAHRVIDLTTPSPPAEPADGPAETPRTEPASHGRAGPRDPSRMA